MNRIARKFADCRARGKAAFVAYLTMGAPSLDASLAAAATLIDEGADILELGIPFSDPVADGPVIRQAALKALAGGVTLGEVLGRIPALRAAHPEIPMIVFSYYNVILAYGLERFAADAAQAGVDGVLVVDVPFEEREELLEVLLPRGLVLVPLAAPNTPVERARSMCQGVGESFLYAVTVKGTTGQRAELPPELTGRLEELKRAVELPVVAGFGIRTPEQGAVIGGHCDGFVIGSALVERFCGA